MWMLPLYLHVNQKSDYDDDTMSDTRPFANESRSLSPYTAAPSFKYYGQLGCQCKNES